MAGWGDDIDEELKKEEEIEVGFCLKFIKLLMKPESMMRNIPRMI